MKIDWTAVIQALLNQIIQNPGQLFTLLSDLFAIFKANPSVVTEVGVPLAKKYFGLS